MVAREKKSHVPSSTTPVRAITIHILKCIHVCLRLRGTHPESYDKKKPKQQIAKEQRRFFSIYMYIEVCIVSIKVYSLRNKQKKLFIM